MLFIHILLEEGSICLYLQCKGVQDGPDCLQNIACDKLCQLCPGVQCKKLSEKFCNVERKASTPECIFRRFAGSINSQNTSS